jgi:hypothetical protein
MELYMGTMGALPFSAAVRKLPAICQPTEKRRFQIARTYSRHRFA